MRVKICGITNLADALVAVEAGAHALGFVFAPSPRQVVPEQVVEILAGLWRVTVNLNAAAATRAAQRRVSCNRYAMHLGQ